MIIIDYESNDINIEATLERSSLRSFTVVKMPAKERFQRALALQRGAQTVTDPHSIIFLSDLHLKIPPKLITTIPKVRKTYEVETFRETRVFLMALQGIRRHKCTKTPRSAWLCYSPSHTRRKRCLFMTTHRFTDV